MTVLEILLPLVAVVLLTLPLIKVFTGKVSAQSAKRRLGVHISGFAGAVVLCLLVAMSNSSVFAAGAVTSSSSSKELSLKMKRTLVGVTITGTILRILSSIFINWFLLL